MRKQLQSRPQVPRAAAGLLRACIESICREATGKRNLNDAIAQLESEEVPQEIIDALDVVRVTGNGALHAGILYGDDDAVTVGRLFTLVETIVHWTLTRRRLISEMRNKLPAEKLRQIDERRTKGK
jgi:hypothetical protein